jgi:hypothetical protein
MSYIFNKGTIDSNNSTASALNSGATWVGTATDVSAYASVVVSCKTDSSGVVYAEFSTDGTNWDSSLSFSVTSGLNEVHRLTITRRYFRARFSNTSPANQTYLRLQSLLGSQTQLNSALNSVVQRDIDTLIVRPLDFNLMVAEGLYQNTANTIKDGFNLDIDTASVPEDLISQGGVYNGFPTNPNTGEIFVEGADTGTVYYSYLASPTDTDYTFGSKAITGAGTYSLGHNIWRCNFAYFVNSSVTSFNAGDISVRLTADVSVVFVVIPTGYSQSFCAAYTVPFGSSVYIDRIQGNLRGSTSGSLDGVFYYKPYGESPRYRFPFELQYGSLYFDDVDYLIKIPALVDIVPRIITASANNLQAKITYRILKIKD